MIVKNILVLTFIFNLMFPNVYDNTSITESENLNALYNPAGLGIDHGWETYVYGTFNQNDIESGTLYFGDKIKGFGYHVGYRKEDRVDNPSEYKIGFGNKITQNLYIGYAYNQPYNEDKFYELGTLYRPFNFLSTAIKYTTENLQDNLDVGLALRPFNNHKLTLGADFNMPNLKFGDENGEYSLFLKIKVFDGIEIGTKYFKSNEENFETINIDLGFDFGKTGIKGSFNSYNQNIGLGFMSGSHKKKVPLQTKNKYISLTLDDIFIEENPKISKFNFDFGLFGFTRIKTGTQLRTWIEKIDNLTENPNIEGLVINLKSISAGGGKRYEIRNALKRFKESGKKIIVYSESGISNRDYSLISLADEIYVNPLTGVDLRGLRMEVTFYRGLLDSLNITPEVWRVSKDGKSYKTAGDPLINTEMSEEMKENYSQLLDDFYEEFIIDIAEGRGWFSLEKDSSRVLHEVDSLINRGPYWTPQIAEKTGLFNHEKDTVSYLIDGTFYPDEFKNYIKELNNDKKLEKFSELNKIENYNYEWKEKKKSKIAIIYAVGGIVSGNSNPGRQGSSIMGDKTIIKAIQSARNDNSIDAIILRIDSGGGSAVASDQMWREVFNTTEDGKENKKPFIASMSDVAASGGYYIACQADTIISYPTTVTGSIGVIGMGLNLSELYKKIGINKEVIKRGEYSDLLTQSRQWTEEEREIQMESIKNFYTEFKDRVLEGRYPLFDKNPDELDKVALGRVWSGTEAKKNGLVDEIGGINESINLAKHMIGIDENSEIEIVEYPSFNKGKIKDDSVASELELILELMPDNIKKELNDLNIIPILRNEKLYFILPYHIDIN